MQLATVAAAWCGRYDLFRARLCTRRFCMQAKDEFASSSLEFA